MARHEVNPEQPADGEDLYGNNAAFTCPSCRKVFIVSGVAGKTPRPCPRCGQATGFVKKDKDGVWRAWIE